jgi:hypothetical protein
VKHSISDDDREFRDAFESLRLAPEAFGHCEHVRLAYIYLCEKSVDDAHEAMKNALIAFLAHSGVNKSKYHETITRAWVMAVRHFMAQSADCVSSDEFIQLNARLLDTKIMLTHYSAEVLFSPQARAQFVAPDIEGIPGP